MGTAIKHPVPDHHL